MAIQPEIILTIATPFLLGNVALYQFLFNRLFISRFRRFNDAAQKEVDRQFNGFVFNMTRLQKKKATIEEKIETIEEDTQILYIVNDFRDKLDYIVRNAKYTYLLFLAAEVFALFALGNNNQPQQIGGAYIIWNPLAEWTLILGVIASAYLVWRLFELNKHLARYEAGKSINEIIQEIKEDEKEVVEI